MTIDFSLNDFFEIIEFRDKNPLQINELFKLATSRAADQHLTTTLRFFQIR